MDSSSLALVQGMKHTRGALREWRRDPGPVLGSWFVRSFAIATTMLFGVWVVSSTVTPDPYFIVVPGVNTDVGVGDYLHVLLRNLTVLALHATACVAGFMAGSSMPAIAERLTGINRIIHEKAGPIAIWWVIGVTAFSLITQTYLLGYSGANISEAFQIPTWQLVLSVLPHALIELTAVFLPMAAWLLASRHGEWENLLAATMVTVAIALPMILVAAWVESTLWPRILIELSPVY